ncbi:CRISPR-associated helicase/endonuclease Cas3 [soil metagenome]
MDSFIARPDREGGAPQLLRDHAEGVAARASVHAETFGCSRLAEWLGWWHDAGKVAPDVQAYLRGETTLKQGPDHSSAGMLEALTLGSFAELAFVIAGHHGGLADGDRLRERVQKKQGDARVTGALEAYRAVLGDRAPDLSQASLPDWLTTRHAQEFWLRMLHSALVDADCLDSEAFSSPESADLRTRDGSLEPLFAALDAKQQELIAGSTGDVNAARAEIYRACIDAAALPPGVFSLTVPTGGGKTRSSMGFALCHAIEHGQRRVIVALPYTSIIEQNADVYRALFKDVNPDAVLEHHSAVASREKPGEADDREERDRLAAETWDAPIIVTTTVQLLESLFANRNSRLRKLHRIVGSVIVLDEVQTLPPELLRPTLDVLQHLVDAYGVTILLCTATPPALVSREGFEGFEDVTELITAPATLFQRLARVTYKLADEPWTWERVAEEMSATPQALVILNTKRDAAALMEALDGDPAMLYLSTQLCGAHRRAVLAEVHRRLAAREPVRLVSTQVVEAGVDLDFPLVLRAIGPLDRIVQAAGRCNREGRLGTRGGRVVVFEPADPGRLPSGAYAAGTGVTKTMLAEGDAVNFDDPTTALAYFERLYARRELDKEQIQALRSRLLFEQTAAAYRLLDDDAVPVVVTYPTSGPEARLLDARLERIERQGRAFTADFRALQPYLVNLRERAHREAVAQGLCHEVVEGVWAWTGRYDAPSEGGGRGLLFELGFLTDRTDGTVT